MGEQECFTKPLPSGYMFPISWQEQDRNAMSYKIHSKRLLIVIRDNNNQLFPCICSFYCFKALTNLVSKLKWNLKRKLGWVKIKYRRKRAMYWYSIPWGIDQNNPLPCIKTSSVKLIWSVLWWSWQRVTWFSWQFSVLRFHQNVMKAWFNYTPVASGKLGKRVTW